MPRMGVASPAHRAMFPSARPPRPQRGCFPSARPVPEVSARQPRCPARRLPATRHHGALEGRLVRRRTQVPGMFSLINLSVKRHVAATMDSAVLGNPPPCSSLLKVGSTRLGALFSALSPSSTPPPGPHGRSPGTPRGSGPGRFAEHPVDAEAAGRTVTFRNKATVWK